MHVIPKLLAKAYKWSLTISLHCAVLQRLVCMIVSCYGRPME